MEGTTLNGTNMTSKQTFFSTTSYTCTKYSSTDVADGCQLKTKYSSKCLYNGSPRECTSDVVISESRIQMTTPSPKSFIQQRVERLYGPGALAQGFFIQSPRKLDLSTSEKTPSPIVGSSNSTSSLPVLRHLRPEFRAQLPILSSPKRTVENGKKETMELKKSKAFADLVHKEEVKDLGSENGGQEDVIEFLPAAAQVILPITVNSNGVNGVAEEEKKDGHHFLKILKLETVRIIKLAEKVEAELDANVDLNEEALGYLRSASGKARLLVNQKMQQFEGKFFQSHF